MGTRALSLARVSLPWLWLSIRGISHQTLLPSVSLLRLIPAPRGLVRMRPVGSIVCCFMSGEPLGSLAGILQHEAQPVGMIRWRFGDWHRGDRLGSQALADQPPDRSGAGVALLDCPGAAPIGLAPFDPLMRSHHGALGQPPATGLQIGTLGALGEHCANRRGNARRVRERVAHGRQFV